jgi:hypothetical protein
VQNNFDALTTTLEGNLRDFSLLERMNILSLLRDWDYGFQIAGPMQIKGFGSKDALENLQAMIASINIAENFRNQNNLQEEDFISYAKMKAESV